MRKYIAFILSLILLYIGVQIISGWVVTTLYVPDVSSLNSNAGGEVAIGQSPTIQLFVVLLSYRSLP